LNLGNQTIVRASKNAMAAKLILELTATKASPPEKNSQSLSHFSLQFSRASLYSCRSSLVERIVVAEPASNLGAPICCLSRLWCVRLPPPDLNEPSIDPAVLESMRRAFSGIEDPSSTPGLRLHATSTSSPAARGNRTTSFAQAVTDGIRRVSHVSVPPSVANSKGYKSFDSTKPGDTCPVPLDSSASNILSGISGSPGEVVPSDGTGTGDLSRVERQLTTVYPEQLFSDKL